jgi:hypothetical protein
MGESFDQCEREVECTEDADGAHTLRMIGSFDHPPQCPAALLSLRHPLEGGQSKPGARRVSP